MAACVKQTSAWVGILFKQTALMWEGVVIVMMMMMMMMILILSAPELKSCLSISQRGFDAVLWNSFCVLCHDLSECSLFYLDIRCDKTCHENRCHLTKTALMFLSQTWVDVIVLIWYHLRYHKPSPVVFLSRNNSSVSSVLHMFTCLCVFLAHWLSSP